MQENRSKVADDNVNDVFELADYLEYFGPYLKKYKGVGCRSDSPAWELWVQIVHFTIHMTIRSLGENVRAISGEDQEEARRLWRRVLSEGRPRESMVIFKSLMPSLAVTFAEEAKGKGLVVEKGSEGVYGD